MPPARRMVHLAAFRTLRALAAGLLVLAANATVRAQIVDRVLAVVAGEPVTLSDVTSAVRLGLVMPGGSKESPEDAALAALIARRLQLVEVNRYLPPDPAAADIDARLAAVRARFTSDAAFEAALRETGVTQVQLRVSIRDTLRIENYLQQRFGAGYQPGEEEVQRYYRVNSGEFVRGGVVQPYAEVRDAARARLVEERRAALVREWIEGLRRRADVTILPK